jgi:hypothetical protein
MNPPNPALRLPPPSGGTPQLIEVHIEELVLHGLDARDRHRIGAAVEHELTRLFTEQGIPPSFAHTNEVPRLDGGTFTLASGSPADTVGGQVAQAVHGSLKR